jgi:hypothetical protein
MHHIFWKAYCNTERNQAITEIQAIISQYGCIVDFQQFSDIALSIRIELEELNVNTLFSALQTYMALDSFENLDSVSSRERQVFLHITFIKGTGNVKNEIPAVPG